MGAIEILSSPERELGVDIDQDELAPCARPGRSRRASRRRARWVTGHLIDATGGMSLGLPI